MKTVILAGGSYGTRAAYTYARVYPASIRALVLIAPAPVSMSVTESFDEGGRAVHLAAARPRTRRPQERALFPFTLFVSPARQANPRKH